MKILDVNQIREADKYTIEHEPIASIDLMERAALTCVNWIVERYDVNSKFEILCGPGNNGGDGLAIGRILIEKKYDVTVFIINYSDKLSENFSVNYNRLKSIIDKNSIQEISSSEEFKNKLNLSQHTVFIDAILGSGLNKPAEGLIADVINYVNRIQLPVIAIDIPSGLYGDQLNHPTDSIIKSTHTLTFQFPKLSFMFVETAKYTGVFSILDIGLHQDYIDNVSTHNYFITNTDVVSFLKPRNKTAHKGDFGHALIVAGSYGKIGASVLSAKSCMRSGAGLLTVHLPKCGYQIMQTSLPEAMVEADDEEQFISTNIRLEKYNAIGAGPGIGNEKQTQNVIKLLIQNTTVPLIFDADAINIISENKTWLSFIPANSIFTPHLKEFERLTGKVENSFERLKMQREFSIKYQLFIVLKGTHTSISCPDGDVFFNSTGNPGMATAGSGDVLTGIITSFVAQGYTSQEACMLGVYIHGLAGDFAASEKTEHGMIASDIIEHLADAFKFIEA
jgi:hydroxyethylthiazole kinase-like uncharacterized protein yjeF